MQILKLSATILHKYYHMVMDISCSQFTLSLSFLTDTISKVFFLEIAKIYLTHKCEQRKELSQSIVVLFVFVK